MTSSLFAPLSSAERISSSLFAPVDPAPVVKQDPIACVLYVSATLDLVSLPDGERLWFGYGDGWFRRLDADAYLWLLGQLWSYAMSQDFLSPAKLDPNVDAGWGDPLPQIVTDEDRAIAEMQEKLANVKRQGIQFGAFTANQVRYGRKPSPRFNWRKEFPTHLDHQYFTE